jgi:hypothetical protein
MSDGSFSYFKPCPCERSHPDEVIRQYGCPHNYVPATPKPPRRPSAAAAEDAARVARVMQRWDAEARDHAQAEERRQWHRAQDRALWDELDAEQRQAEMVAIHEVLEGTRVAEQHRAREEARRLRQRLG